MATLEEKLRGLRLSMKSPFSALKGSSKDMILQPLELIYADTIKRLNDLFDPQTFTLTVKNWWGQTYYDSSYVREAEKVLERFKLPNQDVLEKHIDTIRGLGKEVNLLVSIFRDPYMFLLNENYSMKGYSSPTGIIKSKYWVSPFNPEVVGRALNIIEELTQFKPNQIKLDHIRYGNDSEGVDGDNQDLASYAIRAFKEKGLDALDVVKNRAYGSKEWVRWIEFRRDAITSFVSQAKKIHNNLSVCLFPWPIANKGYHNWSHSGQDFKQLADHAILQPMLYWQDWTKEPENWLEQCLQQMIEFDSSFKHQKPMMPIVALTESEKYSPNELVKNALIVADKYKSISLYHRNDWKSVVG